MRPYPIIALAAVSLALACGEDGKSRITEMNQLRDSTGFPTLTVTVLGLTRDSTLKPVGGAKVLFIRVGEIPPDSIPDSLPPPPPDSIPIDSMFGSPIYLLSDSIPGDSTPPPPPPPSTCGQIGRTITRGLTNRQGVLAVRGLPSGRYDILVEPPEGSQFRAGALCGLNVLRGQSAQVQVTLGAR